MNRARSSRGRARSGRRGGLRLWRRTERAVLGVAMSVAAFFVERRVLKALKHRPSRASRDGSVRLSAAPEKVDDQRDT